MTDPLDALAAALEGAAVKAYSYGTERAVSPQQTFDRVAPLLARMGVTRIADVTGLDHIGIPVAVAIRPNGRSLATSQGKGLTQLHARVSAMMEAAELYHAENAMLPLLHASRVALADSGRPCIDPVDAPQNRTGRYDEAVDIHWAETLDLISGARLWAPYELIHTDYRLPARLSSGAFNATSNGLASGNTLLEALVSGLCEVVERDATTLFDLMPKGAQDARRLCLDTVSQGACTEIIARLDDAGVAAAVWDTTSDIGIPAFQCLIVDRDDRVVRPIHAASGMGCHPRRDIAFLRAVSEAAQSRLTVTTGSRDDVGRESYARFQSPQVLARMREVVLGHSGRRCFTDMPDHPSGDFGDDLSLILTRLGARGLDHVCVANLTRPDLGIAVVRVIVPGLEAMSDAPDYVRGRRALGQLGVSA